MPSIIDGMRGVYAIQGAHPHLPSVAVISHQGSKEREDGMN